MSFTVSEIESQPEVWAQALGLVPTASQFFGLPGERVLFLGCGTSAFVADSLARLRETAGWGLSDAAFASEWIPGRAYDRVVAITRSGTTTEVIEALKLVDSEIPKVAIVGVAGQPIEECVDATLVLDFADESSVVQTRFPTTVLLLGRAVLGENLTSLPERLQKSLAKPFSPEVTLFDHYVYLGSRWTIGLAQEAALKIREAAQAWSESYPLFDYRHGPIAVAGERTLVRIFGAVPEDLITDITSTGATVLSDAEDPLIQLVHAQRVAVALAQSRGLDPDRPRKLTRSVVLT